MALAVAHESFSADGPSIEVAVGPSTAIVRQLRATGRAVPPPVIVRALIDTGAEVTCLDPSALASFVAAGLTPSRLLIANTPLFGGIHPTVEYFVSLSLPAPPGGGRPLAFGNLAASNSRLRQPDSRRFWAATFSPHACSFTTGRPGGSRWPTDRHSRLKRPGPADLIDPRGRGQVTSR
ncbi:MAG: hypothetical protein U0746_03715 [Gemmataceae bacterium]